MGDPQAVFHVKKKQAIEKKALNKELARIEVRERVLDAQEKNLAQNLGTKQQALAANPKDKGAKSLLEHNLEILDKVSDDKKNVYKDRVAAYKSAKEIQKKDALIHDMDQKLQSERLEDLKNAVSQTEKDMEALRNESYQKGDEQTAEDKAANQQAMLEKEEQLEAQENELEEQENAAEASAAEAEKQKETNANNVATACPNACEMSHM